MPVYRALRPEPCVWPFRSVTDRVPSCSSSESDAHWLSPCTRCSRRAAAEKHRTNLPRTGCSEQRWRALGGLLRRACFSVTGSWSLGHSGLRWPAGCRGPRAASPRHRAKTRRPRSASPGWRSPPACSTANREATPRSTRAPVLRCWSPDTARCVSGWPANRYLLLSLLVPPNEQCPRHAGTVCL